MNPVEISLEQMQEIATRSEFHARAITFLRMMQQGIDRQHLIWTLREDVRRLGNELEAARSRLAVEEAEQERDRKLADVYLDQLDRNGVAMGAKKAPATEEAEEPVTA